MNEKGPINQTKLFGLDKFMYELVRLYNNDVLPHPGFPTSNIFKLFLTIRVFNNSMYSLSIVKSLKKTG